MCSWPAYKETFWRLFLWHFIIVADRNYWKQSASVKIFIPFTPTRIIKYVSPQFPSPVPSDLIWKKRDKNFLHWSCTRFSVHTFLFAQLFLVLAFRIEILLQVASNWNFGLNCNVFVHRHDGNRFKVSWGKAGDRQERTRTVSPLALRSVSVTGGTRYLAFSID